MKRPELSPAALELLERLEANAAEAELLRRHRALALVLEAPCDVRRELVEALGDELRRRLAG